MAGSRSGWNEYRRKKPVFSFGLDRKGRFFSLEPDLLAASEPKTEEKE